MSRQNHSSAPPELQCLLGSFFVRDLVVEKKTLLLQPETLTPKPLNPKPLNPTLSPTLNPQQDASRLFTALAKLAPSSHADGEEDLETGFLLYKEFNLSYHNLGFL